MNKQRIYWFSQFAGWGSYIIVILVFNKIIGVPIDTEMMINLMLTLLLGLGLSDVYRRFIIKADWLRLGILQLIHRSIFASILLATVFFFSHSFFAEILLEYGCPSFTLQDSIYNILNITAIFIVWSLLYFLIHFVNNSRMAQIKNLRWEATRNEIELNKLKSQLNPHFIFNSMNSIRALIDDEPAKAKENVTRLANILRNSMMLGKQKLVSLKEELQLVSDYLELEKTRFEERLKVSTYIDKNAYDFKVPPLMVQTLVENGIKHGVSDLPKGGELIIDIKLNGDKSECTIVIVNDGYYDIDKDHNGFGIVNTRERLRLIYGERASFSVSNKNGRVVAEVKVPKY